ncbi:MAG: hypothetical protein HQ595_04705 [Candidatus Omnitrophica bacterium]|nr:hypothetical protein [Candidatus Omnitrophota bacterium]
MKQLAIKVATVYLGLMFGLNITASAAETSYEKIVSETLDQVETEEAIRRDHPELYETIKEERTLVEFYNKYYWYNTKFDQSGERKRWAYNGRYREVRSELKVEHSLTDKLNILTSIPYKEALWKDDYNRNTTSGVGDIWLRAKYKLLQQGQGFVYGAVQPGFRFPGGYDENASPALGKGEIAGELRLIAARSFKSWPVYSKLELAYRARADEPTDEIPHYFEVSYYPKNWLMLKSTIDGVEGLSGTGDDEEDWTKWTAHLILSPNNAFGAERDERIWEFEFAYGNTFEGKNTSNGSEAVFNVSHEF